MKWVTWKNIGVDRMACIWLMISIQYAPSSTIFSTPRTWPATLLSRRRVSTFFLASIVAPGIPPHRGWVKYGYFTAFFAIVN